MENQSSIAISVALEESHPELEEQLWELLCDWDCYGVEASADATQFRIFMPPEISTEQFLNDLRIWLKTRCSHLRARLEVTDVAPRNWNEEWRKYFHATPVGDCFLVLPPWESIPAKYKDRIPLIIEPGMAFGTGTHATTQLCLRLLDRLSLEGKTVLDVGTGSAILSIAASRMGAAWCLGFDIDPDILENAASNLRLNNVNPERVTVCVGPLEMVRERPVFDVVLCNMLFQHSAPLLTRFPRHLKEGGLLVLSGYLIDESRQVYEALKSASFEVRDTLEQDEWGAVIGVKN